MNPEDLKVFGFLAALTDEDREALVEVLESREISEGRSAFREGDEADGLLLLARGQLDLKSKTHGESIGSLVAPAHLGAISLFSVGTRQVTAVAAGTCTLWRLSRSGIARLAADAPHSAFRLAEATARELTELIRPGIAVLVEHTRE